MSVNLRRRDKARAKPVSKSRMKPELELEVEQEPIFKLTLKPESKTASR